MIRPDWSMCPVVLELFSSPFVLKRLGLSVFMSKEHHPGSQLGVGTGWSGPKTLFTDNWLADELHNVLLALLPNEGAPWEISAWGNVMKAGDKVSMHNHRLSHLGGENIWAGVFFVEAPKGSAPLVVSVEQEECWDLLRFDPLPGTVVMFSADTPHEVPKSEFVGERISIAFNVRKKS